ncbi:MAG TPA: proton-conducting transporter membrane subunit, partial [Acidobacteriota bacterium]|nr:proton-conducting transporter membrane subunit [Acidobacteriota bacterium]
GVLFLSSGNIHRAYGSKSTDQVSGALVRLPASGALFLGGFIAITGSPPFGPFMSEFIIVRQAFQTGRFGVVGLVLVLLFAIFIGMGNTVLAMVQGTPEPTGSPGNFHDTPQTVIPIILLFLLVLGLGIFLPPSLAHLLTEAAVYLEGHV